MSAPKINRRGKHIPQRTCVGCRLVLPKRTLIRLVRTPDGIRVDPTGKLPGRGSYLHNQRACWEKALKGALAHALKTEISLTDIEYLKSFLVTLPEDEPTGSPMDIQRP
ncbi:MAG TPA: YlxR family protein [Anaerolineaceae bacterium]